MSMRGKARLNLQVATVNAALERALITLDCVPVEPAEFTFELAGLPVLAHVHDAGLDEVGLHAIVVPTALGRESVQAAIFFEHRKFGAATAFFWLERRAGKYLQTGINYHGSRVVTQALSALTVVPNGFGNRPPKDGYDFHREYEDMFGRSKRGNR